MNVGRFTLFLTLLFTSTVFAEDVPKSIVSLYKNAQAMTLSSSSIKSLEKSILKSDFSNYSHWVQTLKEIKKESNPVKILGACNKTLESSFLNKNKQAYCYKKLVYLLSKSRNFDYSKFKNAKTHFSNLGYKNLKDIKKFSSRNKKTLNWITLMIHDEYLASNKRPRRYLRKLFPSKKIRSLAMANTKGQKNFAKNYRLIRDNVRSCITKKDNSKCTQKIINNYIANTPRVGTKKVFIFAKDLTQQKAFKESRLVLETLLKDDSKNEDYLFSTLWSYIEEKDYKEAYRFLSRNNSLQKKHSQLESSKLRFWIAMTLKHVNDKRYKSVLQSIVTESSISFYSIMASKVLSESVKSQIDLLNPNKKIKYAERPNMDQIKKLHKRIIAFDKIKSYKFFQHEISSIYKLEDSAVIDDAIYSTSSLLSSMEHYLDSFKLLHWGMDKSYIQPNAQVLDILFPRPFKSKISKSSSTMDPFLPLSLIRQESGFNVKAKSRVGARGLMQLMYPTARSLASKIRKTDLFNPNINIRLGTKYLKKLLKKYDQNLVYTLAAYNAGEHRVKKWKGSLFDDSSILHNIERIPYKETRKYVKLIFRNLFYYKGMYQYQDTKDSKNTNEIFDIKLGFND